MKRNSFLYGVLVSINYTLVIALILSYAAAYISPEKLWVIAFFGLAYPFLLVLNLIFLTFWLILFNRYFLISLIGIAIGWNHFNNFIRIIPSLSTATEIKEERKIKVMSFNVRLFDLYNWTNNKSTRNEIIQLIKREAPDIICFQEFFQADDKKYFTTLDTLLKMQEAVNYHVKYTSTVRDKFHFGIAIFSVFPIVNRGSLDFVEGAYNTCIYTDMLIDGDTVRVYNAHLASIHFNKEEYKLIDRLADDDAPLPLKQGVVTIVNQLKNAFIKRAPQADEIAQHTSQSPYPFVICGDFNDTPSSYAYHSISRNLQDAFVVSGKGTGNTYRGKFPSFRIDYIMHSNDIHSFDFTTLKDKLSDHYPITCYLQVE